MLVIAVLGEKKRLSLKGNRFFMFFSYFLFCLWNGFVGFGVRPILIGAFVSFLDGQKE